MMAGRIASERRPVMIRSLLKEAGGMASVGDLYACLVDGAGHSLRQVNRALEYLVERGEVLLLPGSQCRLVEKPDKRKREAFRTLWRAVHQLSLRGTFSSRDLIQVSGVNRRGAFEWLREMRRRGLIRKVGRFSYRLTKDAPHLCFVGPGGAKPGQVKIGLNAAMKWISSPAIRTFIPE